MKAIFICVYVGGKQQSQPWFTLLGVRVPLPFCEVKVREVLFVLEFKQRLIGDSMALREPPGVLVGLHPQLLG